MLCHTLSLKSARSLSSFVDKFLPSGR
jgi:hypothetical protein